MRGPIFDPRVAELEAEALRAELYALRQRAAGDAMDGVAGAAMQGRALSAYEWMGDTIEAFLDERAALKEPTR